MSYQLKMEGISASGVGRISTIIGRYYAMDRDNRWERVKIAYDGLTTAEEVACENWQKAVEAAYQAGEMDEFIKPRIIDGFTRIKSGDAIINFNFRLDRAREMTHAFSDTQFNAFHGEKLTNLKYVGFANYYDEREFEVAFPPLQQKNILGQVLSDHDLKQLR